eukprot:scaffold67217_cov21-Tisochrysis_lutea.AAC.1
MPFHKYCSGSEADSGPPCLVLHAHEVPSSIPGKRALTCVYHGQAANVYTCQYLQHPFLRCAQYRRKMPTCQAIERNSTA